MDVFLIYESWSHMCTSIESDILYIKMPIFAAKGNVVLPKFARFLYKFM